MKDEEKNHEEYLLIRKAFIRLLDNIENFQEAWENLEDIITLRSSFLIDRALEGMRMDFDRALDLLWKNNSFVSEKEKQERNILLAAIDNLVDFAAAEEYAMMNELKSLDTEKDTDEYDNICKKYNLHYAAIENTDVQYAAGIAAWWINQSDETLITYVTQGDDRVREWHLSFEGLTYPKRDFPPDLIPPIEFGCRCYLVADSTRSNVLASIPMKEGFKRKINPVFSESLAKSGRVFSEAHPYFTKSFRNEPQLQNITQRIKKKLWR